MKIACSDGRVHDTSSELNLAERHLLQKLIMLEAVGVPVDRFKKVWDGRSDIKLEGMDEAVRDEGPLALIYKDLEARLTARTGDKPPENEVVLQAFEDTYLGGGIKVEGADNGLCWLVFLNRFDQEVLRLSCQEGDKDTAAADFLQRAERDPSVLDELRARGVSPKMP